MMTFLWRHNDITRNRYLRTGSLTSFKHQMLPSYKRKLGFFHYNLCATSKLGCKTIFLPAVATRKRLGIFFPFNWQLWNMKGYFLITSNPTESKNIKLTNDTSMFWQEFAPSLSSTKVNNNSNNNNNNNSNNNNNNNDKRYTNKMIRTIMIIVNDN